MFECVCILCLRVCVCACKEALVCLFCVCTWPCGVHPVCLCRGSTCGLRMLILPGNCVEVVGAAERERPVVGGGQALLAEALGPTHQTPPVFGSQFKRRVQESTQVLRELEISLRTNHIG